MTTKQIKPRKNAKAVKKEVVVINDLGEEEVKPLGKRVPMHKQKAVGLKPRPGYTARFVVEKAGRIQKFLEAGYQIVKGQDRLDTDNRIQAAKGLGDQCKVVCNWTNLKLGDSPTGVWMEIPTELYEQDQREKLAAVSEVEASIDPRRLQRDNPDAYYGAKFKKEFE